jgi:electron transport complex protein RnfE
MGTYQVLLRLDPQAVASLGIFLPLIVVNGFVLHSLERNSSVSEAASDAVGKGAGFLIALVLVGAIRELLAYGTIFGATIFEYQLPPFALAASVPGGMVILGLLLALYNAVTGQGGELSD